LGTIAPGANVVFDTIINDQSLDLGYNPGTGIFTISGIGNYYVSWWVATDGAEAATSINFDLVLNGSTVSTTSSPIVTGQVSGTALITVGATPATLALVNTTGETVFIANTAVQANFVIVETAL
jgi:hypothetical protein